MPKHGGISQQDLKGRYSNELSEALSGNTEYNQIYNEYVELVITNDWARESLHFTHQKRLEEIEREILLGLDVWNRVSRTLPYMHRGLGMFGALGKIDVSQISDEGIKWLSLVGNLLTGVKVTMALSSELIKRYHTQRLGAPNNCEKVLKALRARLDYLLRQLKTCSPGEYLLNKLQS